MTEMGRYSFTARRSRPARKTRIPEKKSLEEKLRRLNHSRDDYRGQSLAIHGWICARCAREFDESNLHLLTVHHKDGNPRNNPRDGSNWENLCTYCHDDLHSRGLLGDYLEGKSTE
jgi:5-methylcytosine-specific restriction endonuclease McrA